MRWLLVYLAAAFLLGYATACAEDSLRPACGAPCWPDELPLELAGVGSCVEGAWSCDAEGRFTTCDGAVGPTYDVCDGLDNDCDGVVDMYLMTNQRRTLDCGHGGVCRNATWDCVDGEEVCDYPATYEPAETRCDGLDNDCDGRVDEDLSFGPCYDGPVGTERPPCAPGWALCLDGEVECVGATLPGPEVCNGRDDDCDGEIDEGTPGGPTDVVALVDTSGSMSTVFHDVKQALIDAAVDDGKRWALVEVGPDPTPFWIVARPLGTPADFRAAVSAMGVEGGIEPTYDALLGACREAAGPWADGARVALLFGDEVAQSVDGTTELDVAEACADAGVMVYVWTLSGVRDYDLIVAETGGARYDLYAPIDARLATRGCD